MKLASQLKVIMDSSRKSWLVVVRCGDESKHQDWLEPARSNRLWDLGISYYGDQQGRFADDADYYTYFKGGKWDGIFDFFSKFSDQLPAYDFIWLPDDDIETDAGSIENLFALANQYGLQLCQPALTRDSIYSYSITREVPGLTLRHTNFVELMAPLMSASFFEGALPMFEGRPTGRTLDWVWPNMVQDRSLHVAVVDAVPVGHHRPLQRHLWNNLKRLGVNPDEEKKSNQDHYGGQFVVPLTHGAIDKFGRRMGRVSYYARRILATLGWRF